MNHRNQAYPTLRKPALMAVLLLMAGGLLPSGAGISIPNAPHTVIEVTTNNDEFGEGSLCALREAIQTANTGSDFGGCVRTGSGAVIINIPANTYSLTLHGRGEDTNATGDLDIHGCVGLYGAGAETTIIRGDGDPSVNDRVFHIVENAAADYIVTMWDLTITGGYADSDGGGVLNEESLWISRVEVHDNETVENGGGVASSPAHAGQGFQAYLSSSISENAADSGLGGGIYLMGGDLHLDHVDIFGNTASSGAGLYLSGSEKFISWTNLHANTASGRGAGIYLADGNLMLVDSGVYANITGADGGNLYTAPGSGTSSLIRCYIGEGQALSGVGAGIYNAGVLVLHSSTVALNTGGYAAGVYHTPIITSGVMLTIRDSTIANNNTTAAAGLLGEGLYNAQDLTNIEIQNTIFSENGNPGTVDDNCYSANTVRLVSLGYNLDSGDSCGFSLGSDLTGTNPLLGALGYHEGFSLNYELGAGSPALESGGACLATDQRSYDRPLDQNRDGSAVCDIGAFEAEPFYLPPRAWFPLVRKP
jgi:CSLREA domain-containing protein